MSKNLPLSGYTVVDMTHQVAGPFCSMLLGDLGAEVIKIENPPLGDTARNWSFFGPSVFLALNRNKKSAALNLNSPSGREAFRRLIKRADVFVENLTPGVAEKLGAGYASVRKIKKDIIYCSISGYGQNNEYSKLPAWDPVIQALSGLMSVTGEKDREPVRIGVSVVDMGAGFNAALGIISALFLRLKNKKSTLNKRGVFLDISLFDSAAVWMSFWMVFCSIFDKVPERNGSAWPAFFPYQLFPAKDGYVFIGASNEEYWRRLCGALGLNFLLEEPRFKTNELRIQNSPELLKILQNSTTTRKKEDLVQCLNKVEIPCSAVNNVKEVAGDLVLQGRGMLERMIARATRQEFLSVANPLRNSNLVRKKNKAPPDVGKDTEHILRSLGFSGKQIRDIVLENESP
jgi:crotonobetainyl-CoA:carnitine CoA-transferase CaiB-like acyl-CoA transferase